MRHIRICAALLGLLALVSCDVEHETEEPIARTKRDEVEAIFLSQVGVKEATGKNDGKEVEAYLAATGLTKGNPWCAAFCAWCLDQASVPNPHSAYSPDWFRSRVIYSLSVSRQNNSSKAQPQQGDIFGIYFSSMGRVAHVGFVHEWGNTWIQTVEGNSNDDGSRDGDGVYRKRRLKSQIYAVSSWID